MAHICVIDDNPLILKSVELALRKIGHAVTTLDNLDLFIKILDGQTFDLIICDYSIMRDSIKEIIALVSKKMPSVRFMIMSGRIPDDLKDIPFIQKPFRISELRKKVELILRGEE